MHLSLSEWGGARIEPYLLAEILSGATIWSLPADWLVALVYHESRGKPYAKRGEPGFLSRYESGIIRLVEGNRTSERLFTVNPLDFASSYGLMQIMWSTAWERGFRGQYPSELFEPRENVYWGCAELHRQLDRAGGDFGVALDAYNDGRVNSRDAEGNLTDHDYTDRVRQAYLDVFQVHEAPAFPIL